MTNLTTSAGTGSRRVLRLAAAGLGTLIAGLLAAAFWILAQAQYLNDYCTTRAPQPESPITGGRPAHLDGPWTVVCEYDGAPTMAIVEPLPFVGAVVLAAVVLGIGVMAFRWAWRATKPTGSVLFPPV